MTLHLPIARPQRFDARARAALGHELRAAAVDTLQVNLGKRCNQACRHCHVDAGPARTESMSEAHARRCVELVARDGIDVLDLTGGAPELHPMFRWMVTAARGHGARVLVRHNLTVVHEPGCDDLPDFFAAHRAALFCSLPHYTADATDRQRGAGVFERSVDALRRLNAAGYGLGDPARPLTLVHNPVGAFLPGDARDLEDDFRRALLERHDVRFDRLVSITNMPVLRFRDWLARAGQLARYERALEDAFNPATLPALMCRATVSVAWDGRLYDCDFNQMLELPLRDAAGHLDDFDLDALVARRVATADHCFGCTAGSGSSCGGALT